ncbi:MAG TPA: AAA family ATPase, partial [Fimbriimonadaceae bacterium]|nr:AAA family ATPase [Fimbriimonadaceae bacterium]
KSFTDTEAVLRQCEGALGQLRLEEDGLGGRSRALLAERAALEGRKRGIEATIQSHEGLALGSKAVVEAGERGRLAGPFTPVGDAIQTSPAYAHAIEVALGASANDLIVSAMPAAVAAITYLTERSLGRTTFLPASSMRSTFPVDRALAAQPGAIGWASDLVIADEGQRPVIEVLLGGVLVVSDLDAALGLADSSGWEKIVTLGGELLHASGAIAGGRGAKQHGGLVQRKTDLAELEAQIDGLGKKIEASSDELAQAGKQRQVLLAEAATAKLELSDRSAVLSEAREFFRTLASELQVAERSREKLVREVEALSLEPEIPPQPDLEGLQIARDSLMNEFAARAADAEQAKRRLIEAEGRLDQARKRTTAASKRFEAARASEAQRNARLASLDPERNKVRLEIEKHRRESADSAARRGQTEIELQSAQQEKDVHLREGIRLSEEVKAVRAALAAMGEANHQAEISRARADAKRAAAGERLIEEYGITEVEALAREASVEIPADAQNVASRLRREIRAMGDVNVGAIEAYERLDTRHGELSAQRADIVEGIEQVRASIVELDKLTRDRFVETFEKVEAAYRDMFEKLLGGGEGRIFLDNPTSVLDTGIGIEITLPGKKKQRLELLSGGERALCATAFLFALLKVKPSPLVVLDEVDAPLDGRNVERFGDLLEEFIEGTQFIVITHNRTTIARAPVWLGVTMQEPGVSTLIPVRLPHEPTPAERVGSAVVSAN